MLRICVLFMLELIQACAAGPNICVYHWTSCPLVEQRLWHIQAIGGKIACQHGLCKSLTFWDCIATILSCYCQDPGLRHSLWISQPALVQPSGVISIMKLTTRRCVSTCSCYPGASERAVEVWRFGNVMHLSLEQSNFIATLKPSNILSAKLTAQPQVVNQLWQADITPFEFKSMAMSSSWESTKGLRARWALRDIGLCSSVFSQVNSL